MLVAALLAIIEIGLVIFYPVISIAGSEGVLRYSFLEYIFLFAEGQADNYVNIIKEYFNFESVTTAQNVALITLIGGGVMILTLVISLVMAAAKKGRAAGVFQLIASIVAFASMVMTRIVFNSDPDSSIQFVSLSTYYSTAFAIIASMMLAGAILSITRPDIAIGVDKSKNQAAARPMLYAAPVAPVVPVQTVAARPAAYTAPTMPAAAPAAAASPAPVSTVTNISSTPAPAPAAPSGDTYSCPICGSQQKLDMPFCTFCGNPNPNTQE